MWDPKTSERIANILQIIAAPPNLRPHPEDRSIMSFDGGIIRTGTGLTDYEFIDGTVAFFGSGLNVGLTIKFPHGEEITVQSTYTYCGGCTNHLALKAKFCNQCGLKKP